MQSSAEHFDDVWSARISTECVTNRKFSLCVVTTSSKGCLGGRGNDAADLNSTSMHWREGDHVIEWGDQSVRSSNHGKSNFQLPAAHCHRKKRMDDYVVEASQGPILWWKLPTSTIMAERRDRVAKDRPCWIQKWVESDVVTLYLIGAWKWEFIEDISRKLEVWKLLSHKFVDVQLWNGSNDCTQHNVH